MISNSLKLTGIQTISKLKNAANNVEYTNTFTGEKRSLMVKTAYIAVPMTKPNCTEEVILLRKLDVSGYNCCKSFNTALRANHKDVPENCAKMTTGSKYFGLNVNKSKEFQ